MDEKMKPIPEEKLKDVVGGYNDLTSTELAYFKKKGIIIQSGGANAPDEFLMNLNGSVRVLTEDEVQFLRDECSQEQNGKTFGAFR